jgi:hypothetical protein
MLWSLAYFGDTLQAFRMTPIRDDARREAVLARRSDLARTIGVKLRDDRATTRYDDARDAVENTAGGVGMVEHHRDQRGIRTDRLGVQRGCVRDDVLNCAMSCSLWSRSR